MSSAPQSHLTGVRGWETPAEQNALRYLAERVPANGKIVEIGSEFGMSTSILAKFSRADVTVFAVDLFPDEMYNAHQSEMARIGVLSKIEYHRSDSFTASAMWKRLAYPDQPPQIDLLFIDGDHTTKGVIVDMAGWFPYVKHGGVVVFHDTMAYSNERPHEQHEWVQRAIEGWRAGELIGNVVNLDPREWIEAVPVDSMRVFVHTGGGNA